MFKTVVVTKPLVSGSTSPIFFPNFVYMCCIDLCELNLNFTIFLFKTVVITKLLVFGILFSTSLIFVFKKVVVTKPLISELK